MTQILVWEHKYGSEYYDASTPEKLEAAAKSILHDLVHNMQYIYPPDDPMEYMEYSGIDMEQAELTDEQVAGLPTAGMRAEAEKHRKRLKARLREAGQAQNEYDRVIAIVNGTAEPVVFRRRSRYTDDEWAQVLAKWPDTDFDDEGNMLRLPSAWGILQNRNGHEYETYSLENLQ